MDSGEHRWIYKSRYADTLRGVTSLVLAFLFAVSSPLSLAVAYAQTTSDDGCKRRSKNPSLKRPVSPVAPE